MSSFTANREKGGWLVESQLDNLIFDRRVVVEDSDVLELFKTFVESSKPEVLNEAM